MGRVYAVGRGRLVAKSVRGRERAVVLLLNSLTHRQQGACEGQLFIFDTLRSLSAVHSVAKN